MTLLLGGGLISLDNLYSISGVDYEEISPNADTYTFFKQWLKLICVKYPNIHHGIWIGRVRPNTNGFAIVQIYNTDDVNSDGLPRYSAGLALRPQNGIPTIDTFGTWEFNYEMN